MGLNIKWTIHVIEENLFRVRENDYIYPHEVDADIRSRGFKEGSFDAVLAVAVHSGAYAWGVNNILGRGGFFQVPWWEDKWLFPWFIVHEFHHIVDAMFLFSGHPEYPHNHPGAARALGEYLPHSGTDWDLNAEILQFWERTDWFDLINNGNWGSIKTSIDSDADLIPDKDTNVPLDELRFKSESSKKDTDHDGVPDLTETMAGIFTLGNPVHYDSDRDHIRDSKDTEPIYPFNTTVPNTLHLSLEQDLREWPKAGKYFFDKADGTSSALHLAYSEDQLFVGVKIPASLSRLQLIVDANNDGLYHGNDNIEIWLNGNTIETVNHLNAAAVPVGDHSDMIISPLPAEGFSGVSKVSSDESYYQLIIPKLSQYGLDLTPREKIGVFINLIGYGTLLELNDFLTVTIGKELKDVPIVQNNKTIITADEKYLNPLNLHTSAFPNPSTEFFNLKVTGGNQPINLIITDALGREVDRRTGLAAHATLQVGNNFKPGVYYAEVVQGNQRTVVKLIKF